MRDGAINRNYSLDFLRVMACLMVLLVHTGHKIGLSWTGFGARGVELFLILSGYLAMMSYDRMASRNQDSVKAYYLNRVKRIIPIYWLTCIVIWCYDAVFYFIIRDYSLSQIFLGAEAPCGIGFLRYFFFLQQIIPAKDYYLWNNRYALWTMSTFAVFYILVPVIYRLAKNKWRLFVVTLGIWAATPFAIRLLAEQLARQGMDEPLYFATQFPLNKLYCLLIGVVIWKASKMEKIVIGGVALSLCLLTQMDFYGFELLWTALLCLVLILPPWIPRTAIGQNTLHIAANSSFALYLFHPLAISICEVVNGTLQMPAALFFVMMVGMSLAAALIMNGVVKRTMKKFAHP